MENLKLKLIEVITHNYDVKTFRFALKKEISFKPGQYLILALDIRGKSVSKAFSISNSPTENGFVQFTKKISRSDFSKTLLNLKIGEEYSFRLPMGNFTFQGEFPKVAFLSGGIGITPVRSIFKYATDRQFSCSMILLYSSSTLEYLIFRDDFNSMQKINKNLKIVYTLTQCDEKIPGYRSGWIDAEMIKEEIPDLFNRIFFICGPPGMVDAMRQMLLNKLNLSATQIKTEDFIGY